MNVKVINTEEQAWGTNCVVHSTWSCSINTGIATDTDFENFRIRYRLSTSEDVTNQTETDTWVSEDDVPSATVYANICFHTDRVMEISNFDLTFKTVDIADGTMSV